MNDSTKQFLSNTVSSVSNKLDRVAAILFGSLPRLRSSRSLRLILSDDEGLASSVNSCSRSHVVTGSDALSSYVIRRFPRKQPEMKAFSWKRKLRVIKGNLNKIFFILFVS